MCNGETTSDDRFEILDQNVAWNAVHWNGRNLKPFPDGWGRIPTREERVQLHDIRVIMSLCRWKTQRQTPSCPNNSSVQCLLHRCFTNRPRCQDIESHFVYLLPYFFRCSPQHLDTLTGYLSCMLVNLACFPTYEKTVQSVLLHALLAEYRKQVTIFIKQRSWRLYSHWAPKK